MLLALPSSTFAHDPYTHDGEVISDGDYAVGNVFLASSGRVRTNFGNVGNCPTYISNCFVEVRFLSKCDEFWCFGFDDRSGWIRVPAGQDFMEFCGANDYQQWQMQIKISWFAQSTKTVRYSGEYESVLGIDGGYDQFLLPKFLLNMTNNTAGGTATPWRQSPRRVTPVPSRPRAL